ncbi:hypothetical protein PANDA_009133 [Ailuropoda melanoleuca]|uniref:Interleukin-15 receptor subunit alpha n=1 Tax=Ailuropoda melanoleuca TaxID=9646 RepID=D2HEC0_AILME|nr:hypothetical protein PANDA_009133 [Ailuropoda melanoleuca]
MLAGITCPPPKSVEHADIRVKSYKVSSRERYTCNSGFKRKAGTSSLTECVLNETTNIAHWTIPNLKCIRDPSLTHLRPSSTEVPAGVTPEPESTSLSGKEPAFTSKSDTTVATKPAVVPGSRLMPSKPPATGTTGPIRKEPSPAPPQATAKASEHSPSASQETPGTYSYNSGTVTAPHCQATDVGTGELTHHKTASFHYAQLHFHPGLSRKPQSCISKAKMGDVSCTRGRVLLVETQVQTAEQSGRCDSWSTVRPPAPQMFRVVILHIGQRRSSHLSLCSVSCVRYFFWSVTKNRGTVLLSSHRQLDGKVRMGYKHGIEVEPVLSAPRMPATSASNFPHSLGDPNENFSTQTASYLPILLVNTAAASLPSGSAPTSPVDKDARPSPSTHAALPPHPVHSNYKRTCGCSLRELGTTLILYARVQYTAPATQQVLDDGQSRSVTIPRYTNINLAFAPSDSTLALLTGPHSKLHQADGGG